MQTTCLIFNNDFIYTNYLLNSPYQSIVLFNKVAEGIKFVIISETSLKMLCDCIIMIIYVIQFYVANPAMGHYGFVICVQILLH